MGELASGAGSTPTPIVQLAEPTGMVKVNGYVSAEMMFFGTGANGNTLNYDLYGIRIIGTEPDRSDNKHGAVLYVPYLLGAGLATMGNFTGLATGYLAVAARICDTLTFTPEAAFATYLDAIVGNSPIVFSPADDATPALLAFPDLMNFHGLVLDINPGTATDGAGLISLWT